jgi:hypothetical protein
MSDIAGAPRSTVDESETELDEQGLEQLEEEQDEG